MADWQAIQQQIDREFECSHSDARVAVRITANGVKQYYRQCQRCGTKLAGPIKYAELSAADLRQPLPIDDALQRSWWDRRAARSRELHDQAVMAEKDAWWQRYNAYLQTPKWKVKSQRVIRRDVICKACESRPAVQAHHLTYKHVFDEPLFDLIGVCLECHAKLHNPERFVELSGATP